KTVWTFLIFAFASSCVSLGFFFSGFSTPSSFFAWSGFSFVLAERSQSIRPFWTIVRSWNVYLCCSRHLAIAAKLPPPPPGPPGGGPPPWARAACAARASSAPVTARLLLIRMVAISLLGCRRLQFSICNLQSPLLVAQGIDRIQP